MASENALELLRKVRGLVDQAIAELEGAHSVGDPSSESKRQMPIGNRSQTALSFESNALAFMNKYARGLNGTQKFTLLLAWLSKGKCGVEVSLQNIESHWNNMRTVLGGEFNRVSSNRAKAQGWIDSPKKGFYILCDSWQECLPNA